MNFSLLFSTQAKSDLQKINSQPHLLKQFKAVRKALGALETNPRHPSLQTHKYTSLHGLHGEEIFEAYAENNTPGTYRIFWHYGPKRGEITIIAIIAHL